jgi:3-oxoacyl-[acyl-carrier protein] reductase
MAAKNRRVLVTGASSGLGRACAEIFLARGDDVVAQYRTQAAPVEALAARFGSDRVSAVQADLATEGACAELVAQAAPFSVLVHSAGVWEPGPISELSADQLERMFRTNTFSSYYLSREAARTMKQGSLLFVGSTAGQRGEPGHSPYAGSKAALWGLVQSLAQELAPQIRVNLVSPGWVRTPMTEKALASPGREQSIRQAVPLHRVAEPEDVAEALFYLADDVAARHLTGVDLPVSGGALLPLPRG